MRSTALCLSLLLAIGCSGDKTGTEDTGVGTTIGDDDDDTGIDGQPLYSQHCASCHGAEGEGGGVAPDPMATYVTGSTEAEVSAQIQNGGGSMPPITALTPAEADAVAAWVVAEFSAR